MCCQCNFFVTLTLPAGGCATMVLKRVLMNTPSQCITCTANCFLAAHSKNLVVYCPCLYIGSLYAQCQYRLSLVQETHPYIAVSRKLGTHCSKIRTRLWLKFLLKLAYFCSVLLEIAVACTFLSSFCQSCFSEAARVSPVNQRLIAFSGKLKFQWQLEEICF